MTVSEKNRQRRSMFFFTLYIAVAVAVIVFIFKKDSILSLMGVQVYAEAADTEQSGIAAGDYEPETPGDNVTILKAAGGSDALNAVSPTDKDGDGVDDYTDIVQGAKAYIKKKPVYDDRYVSGGFPPESRGACTDVVWRALDAAGYDLKALVDEDILENPGRYPEIEKPDFDIEFRRVRNLNRFFDAFAYPVTTSLENPEDWQPGDIVIFPSHIGICSDKRNSKGIPYLLHHDMGGAREADDMESTPIRAHYRWPTEK